METSTKRCDLGSKTPSMSSFETGLRTSRLVKSGLSLQKVY